MSSIETRENAEAVAAYLNAALEAEPESLRALCGTSVPFDVEKGEAADVVVAPGPGGGWRLRPIGLINGLFSPTHRVAEVYEDGDESRIARFTVVDVSRPRDAREAEAASGA